MFISTSEEIIFIVSILRSEQKDNIPKGNSLQQAMHLPLKFELVGFISKVVSATFLLVYFVCLKDSTCETKKNVFYITSEALFVLEIIKF